MRVIRALVCLSVWGIATIAFGAENTFGTTATSYMSVGPDEFRGTTSMSPPGCSNTSCTSTAATGIPSSAFQPAPS